MYVCTHENKHLHNKSQETLSISCYTSCEGLGLAKTTKNMWKSLSAGGKVAVSSVCWCQDRGLFCSVLQRNQPKHNWHPCSSWIPVEGHTLRPASVPLLMRESKKKCSLPWNGWWNQVIFQGMLPSHKPWEQRFSFWSPSSSRKPVKGDVHRLFVLMCVL